MTIIEKYKYPGIALPWGNTLESYFEFKKDSDREVVKTEVRMAVLTSFNERVMLPSFGTSIPSRLFENMEEGIEGTLKQEINTSLNNWLGDRVSVVDIQVNTDVDNHSIDIKIVYKLKIDNELQEYNLGVSL